ncbi:MAG: transposase [Treponemataceae bacterium]
MKCRRACRVNFKSGDSYFHHLYEKRGRGAADKTPVFRLLKCGDMVYACIVKNTTTDALLTVIKEKVIPDSIMYSNSYASYSKLKTSGVKHERIDHS